MSDSTALINGDARHAARSAWLFAFAEGDDLSGATLGTMFNKSRSWGRDRRAEGRRWLATLTPDAPAVMPAEPTPAPQVAAVMPPEPTPEPVAVERHGPVNPQDTAGKLMRHATVAAVVIVAAVAAVMSYAHMYEVAHAAGEGWRAYLLPFSVDGFVVAASMTAVRNKRANRPAGFLPCLSIALGLAASLAANVVAAEPTTVGRVVAAWPSVALALSFELLLRQGAPGVVDHAAAGTDQPEAQCPSQPMSFARAT